RARDSRCGMRLLPRSRGPDGGRAPGADAQHELVSRLPPQSRATPSAAERGHQHDLGSTGRSGRLRGSAPRAEQHQSPDRLLHMSSMKPKSPQDPSKVGTEAVDSGARDSANATPPTV